MSNQDDLVVVHSRREALIIGAVWLASTVYCCTYCYLFGYIRDGRPLGAADVQPILGMPSWFFWGVFVALERSAWCSRSGSPGFS